MTCSKGVRHAVWAGAAAAAWLAAAPAFAEPTKPPVELPQTPVAVVPAAPPAPIPVIDNPTPEAVELSHHLVGLVLDQISRSKSVFDAGVATVEGKMKEQADKNPGGTAALAYQRFAGWPRMFADAAWEELDQDKPVLSDILGGYIAHHFTEAELRRTVALLEGPVGQEAPAAIVASVGKKGSSLAFSPQAQRALDDYKASPEGKSVKAKLASLAHDKSFEPVAFDVIAAWFPGTARRWGEKAEAAEKARRAAAAAPAPAH
jgi:hypothetical protein